MSCTHLFMGLLGIFVVLFQLFFLLPLQLFWENVILNGIWYQLVPAHKKPSLTKINSLRLFSLLSLSLLTHTYLSDPSLQENYAPVFDEVMCHFFSSRICPSELTCASHRAELMSRYSWKRPLSLCLQATFLFIWMASL